MTPAERRAHIARYAEGPEQLATALAKVPETARQWRPGPGKWSVHEVIVHCADSEVNSHSRLRYLVGEAAPATIFGYDQDRWAAVMNYHAHPLEPALLTIRAVRANTVPLLERMSDADWQRTGTHTEHPSYGVEQWMTAYAEHLEIHTRQIERNLAAWKQR